MTTRTETAATATAVAINPAAITIEPYPGVAGRRAVVVGGARWATIWMERHGARGVSYWFQQTGRSGPIERKREPGDPGIGRRGYTVTVYSDALAKLRSDGVDVAPLETRLLDEARKLVAEGLLVDPSIVEREKQERQRRHDDEANAERESVRAADLATAHKLIDDHSHGHDGGVDIDIDGLANAIADQFRIERNRP